MASTILRFLAKAIIGFVGLTAVLVLAFRFVPVPVTATMLMDDNGITKDWESLGNIDRNLVSAVIASEDQRFCQHSGFDTEAIEQAKQQRLRFVVDGVGRVTLVGAELDRQARQSILRGE